MEYVVAAVILLVVLVVGAVGLVVPRMRRRQLPPPSAGGTTTLERPPAGQAPTAPPILVPETPTGQVPVEELPPLVETPVIAEPQQRFETPEPTAGRLVRLRARLSRSQNVLGRGLLSVLSRDHLTRTTGRRSRTA